MSVEATRQDLERALVTLMKDEPVRRIRVSRLVELAGVSRASFYRHYDSVTAMLEEIVTEYMDALRDMNVNFVASKFETDLEKPDPLIVEAMAYHRAHAELFLALTGPNGSERFREEIGQSVRKHYVGKLTFNYIQLSYSDFYGAFCGSGYIAAMRHWLENRQDVTDEQMAVIVSKILYGYFLHDIWTKDKKGGGRSLNQRNG